MSEKKYKAPALEKGLEIIELLAAEKNPLSMGEIAHKLGYSKNEIFRMIFILQKYEYIRRLENTDLFIITEKLFSMGMQIGHIPTLLEKTIPEMRKLSEEIRQSCHLSVLNNTRFVVVGRVESPAAIGFSVRAGHNAYAHLSSSGLLLLAMSEKQYTLTLIDKIASEYQGELKKETILPLLERIATDGHMIKTSMFHESITDIAVPITKGEKGTMLAALAVPFIENKNHPITQKEVLQELKKLAHEISITSGNLTRP